MRQDITLKALACSYFPHASPNTAVKRLSRWIERDRELADELHKTGFRKGCRLLTPIQHELITRRFGNPKRTGGKTDTLPEAPCVYPPRPPPRARPRGAHHARHAARRNTHPHRCCKCCKCCNL